MQLGSFGANAGQLFDELVELNLNTPEAVSQLVVGNGSQSLAEISNAEYRRLKAFLIDTQSELVLEDGSSDVLLAGLLKKSASQILKNHPTGRGMGRPSRLTQIAKAYARMPASEAAA
jgi:hypothetical protein